jgi:hypothetical protein
VKHPQCDLAVLHQYGFGDFQPQPVGRELRGCQRIEYRRQERFFAKASPSPRDGSLPNSAPARRPV